VQSNLRQKEKKKKKNYSARINVQSISQQQHSGGRLQIVLLPEDVLFKTVH